MEKNWKEQYDNYSKRLPFYDLRKWYEKDGNSNYASLNVSIYKGWISISVGIDLKQDSKNRDKWSTVGIPMDIGYTSFAVILNFIKSGDKDYLKIPIVRTSKDDNGKAIKDSVNTVAQLVIGKNEKEYYFGILYPQKTNVHFILHPQMPGKQWLVAKKDGLVDTLELSRVYAISYFTNLLKDLDKVKEEMTTLFNKAYPTMVKSVSTNVSNTPAVEELDIDSL